jgi:hypothetical protein
LRSGDVFLPASRRHVSVPNLVYDPVRWQAERADAYTELQLPQAPDDFCGRLQREFDTVAQQAAQGLPTNAFVTIRRDRLHLKKRDALELPPRIIQLRRTLSATPHSDATSRACGRSYCSSRRAATGAARKNRV